MIIDLVQIQTLGEKKRDENKKLRSFMKAHDHSDRILRRISQDVQDQIDCTACANCCRVATTKVTDRDIDRIARHLKTSVARVTADFTAFDPEDGVRSLKWTKGSGCVFLDGNLCGIYEGRPNIRQRYPHVVRGDGSIASRMWDFVDRATICPIVYNTLEAFKEHLRFRR